MAIDRTDWQTWGNLGEIWEESWGKSWGNLEGILGKSWGNLGEILGKSRGNLGKILGKSWGNLGGNPQWIITLSGACPGQLLGHILSKMDSSPWCYMHL